MHLPRWIIRHNFAMCTGQVGGFGRYQWIHVTLISIPGLFMASQNLLNNFVSGSPTHHCSLPTNYSLPANHTLSIEQVSCLTVYTTCMTMYDHVWPCMVTCSICSSLDRDVIVSQMEPKTLLRAFIPMDSSGAKLDRCRRLRIFAISSLYCMIRSTHWHQFLPHWSRYVEPQWQLLADNSSINTSLLRTEECLDGWAFDQSEFLSTTVSEVTKGNPSICFFTCIHTPLGSNHHQKFKRPHICPQSKLCPSPTDGWTCIPKESDSLSLLV